MTMKMKTPCRQLMRSGKYHISWGPPTIVDTTSIIHVMPITTTSFMQILPSAALKQYTYVRNQIDLHQSYFMTRVIPERMWINFLSSNFSVKAGGGVHRRHYVNKSLSVTSMACLSNGYFINSCYATTIKIPKIKHFW